MARHLDRRHLLRITAGLVVALPLAAAGCAPENGHQHLRIAYQQFGSTRLMEAWITRTAATFSADHPQVVIDLVPIVAAENDYFTKNELMMGSAATSPDLVYEDTFILLSDVDAGYLVPLDAWTDAWVDWNEIEPSFRTATQAEDGKTYAVPTHTDTRAIWTHRQTFARAGLPANWAPKQWSDLLDAARTIKRATPQVTPFFLFAGKPQGEKASMQGFEMLLYGTESRLYDAKQHKWIVGGRGFVDALDFVRTLFAEDLTLPIGQCLDPNIGDTIHGELLPAGKLGILMDGSWISQNWIGGVWDDWATALGWVRMPTQHGQGKGWVTLAGGWSWVIPRYARDPGLSFEFLAHLQSRENCVQRAIEDQHITIRSDVAADPRYRTYGPTVEFFTSLVGEADHRPALAPYPQVSSAIQQAMEDVMTMSRTPQAAAAAYDAKVIDIVGAESTVREGT